MNCIFTASFGNDFQQLNNITHEYMKKYAEKTNSEFVVITDSSPVRKKHDAVELMLKCKWRIKELFKKYKRVLYLDSDVLVLPSAKNIFEIVPENCIAAFEEGHKYPGNLNCYLRYIIEYNKSLKTKKLPPENPNIKKYYNAGIFLADSNTEEFFTEPPVRIVEVHPDLGEQNYFNLMVQKHCNTGKIKIFDLPIEFNRMVVWRDATLDNIMKSSFIHYSITPNMRRIGLIKIHLSEHKRRFKY